MTSEIAADGSHVPKGITSLLDDSPDPVDVHVGTRLRIRRGLVGITQHQLAAAVGVSFQQIQKYERGTNRISASRLFDIARFLDVDITFFFEGIDEALLSTRQTPASYRSRDGAGDGEGSYEVDPLQRNDTLELARLFWDLPTDLLRQRLLDFMRALVRGS